MLTGEGEKGVKTKGEERENEEGVRHDTHAGLEKGFKHQLTGVAIGIVSRVHRGAERQQQSNAGNKAFERGPDQCCSALCISGVNVLRWRLVVDKKKKKRRKAGDGGRVES